MKLCIEKNTQKILYMSCWTIVGKVSNYIDSKPSNIAGVRFLENAAIVKTAIVETKGQWKKGGSVPGLQ